MKKILMKKDENNNGKNEIKMKIKMKINKK